MVTRDAILALAERELDAKVAEAFGWQWWTDDEVSLLHSPDDSEELRDAIGKGLMPKWKAGKEGAPNFGNIPHWSGNWTGAGLIVAKMKKRGYARLVLDSGLGRDWELWGAEFLNTSNDTEVYGETAPLAVARAALLALREEE